MDVSLSGSRVFIGFLALLSLSLISCGNRYDLSTERGRRSRIDDANFHLSSGNCGAAAEAIDPLYGSPYVNDEVRIIKSSTFACYASFNLLTFISNLASNSNYFVGIAKSLTSGAGDGARGSLYGAVDVITQGTAAINASARTAKENTYMLFLQLGVVSAIQRNYGSPASDGSQGANLVYEAAGANPAGEMTDTDACALAAAFSHISDSFGQSDLTDSTSSGLVSSLNSVCVGLGYSSCSSINRVRSGCDGTDAESVTAASVVGGVNSSL